MLNERQQAAVKARADNKCQRKLPGCQTIAIYVELAYPAEQLTYLRRDRDNPDNSLTTCLNCKQGWI